MFRYAPLYLSDQTAGTVVNPGTSDTIAAHLWEIHLRLQAAMASTNIDEIAGLLFWAEQHRRSISVSLATVES